MKQSLVMVLPSFSTFLPHTVSMVPSPFVAFILLDLRSYIVTSMVLSTPYSSANHTPASTRKTRAKKTKPKVEGFDIVAGILYSMPRSKTIAGKGTANTAFRHLLTIYTESINGAEKIHLPWHPPS